jgi:hypothetical protein
MRQVFLIESADDGQIDADAEKDKQTHAVIGGRLGGRGTRVTGTLPQRGSLCRRAVDNRLTGRLVSHGYLVCFGSLVSLVGAENGLDSPCKGRCVRPGSADHFGRLASAFTSVMHSNGNPRPHEKFHIVISVAEGDDVFAVNS